MACEIQIHFVPTTIAKGVGGCEDRMRRMQDHKANIFSF